MVANDNCSACEFQNGLASSRRYDENRLERNRKPLGRRVQHSNGWRGGSEPNLFKHVGLEAREIPAVGEVFSLDFPLYRTSSPPQAARSEEHTSELQSLTNLVCRLLLEKKNCDTSSHTQP